MSSPNRDANFGPEKTSSQYKSGKPAELHVNRDERKV
jgi:hypothetical protein